MDGELKIERPKRGFGGGGKKLEKELRKMEGRDGKRRRGKGREGRRIEGKRGLERRKRESQGGWKRKKKRTGKGGRVKKRKGRKRETEGGDHSVAGVHVARSSNGKEGKGSSYGERKQASERTSEQVSVCR